MKTCGKQLNIILKILSSQLDRLIKGELISEWLLEANENISVFLPYLSEIGQIKKRVQIIMLEDK